MNSFDSFKLSDPLLRALKRMTFTTPTPIQARVIPAAMQGRDVLALAQTGTGKTAAFLLPILHQMTVTPKLKALIMAPTRELALQIQDVIKALTVNLPHLKSCLIIGGASYNRQLQELAQKPAFIIATPGRLNDHLSNGRLKFSSPLVVVLDEVDRMLDMGFVKQIEEAFRSIPQDRQTLLFSATMPPPMRKLALKLTENAEEVSVGATQRPVERIKQSHLKVEGPLKNQTILDRLLNESGSALVFARTKMRADRLSRFLKKNGLKATAIHGNRTQSQRQEAIKGFVQGRYAVLVATDIASRGLDIPNIELVVNYDLPETSEDYIHRIGRTARAGAQGSALSLVTPQEMGHWKRIARL